MLGVRNAMTIRKLMPTTRNLFCFLAMGASASAAACDGTVSSLPAGAPSLPVSGDDASFSGDAQASGDGQGSTLGGDSSLFADTSLVDDSGPGFPSIAPRPSFGATVHAAVP